MGTMPGEESTVHCPTCGRDIAALSATVHQATCARRQGRHRAEEEHESTADVHHQQPILEREGGPTAEEIRQDTSQSADRQEAASPSTATEPRPSGPPHDLHQHDWSCPRCTLINNVSRLHCEACGYVNISNMSTQRNANTQSQPTTMQVEVREINPRTVATATTAVSILSWSALGGLLAGPVGAAIGGLGAAAMSLSQSQQRQTQPMFSFTSTRVTPQGITTTRYVTGNHHGGNNNNNNRRGPRTVVLMHSTPPGSLASEYLLRRMLLLQGLHQGAIDDMTYEELVERFHADSRRGASADTIAALPCTRLNDETAADFVEKPCNICLEDLTAGQDMRQLPACGHAFHKECIDEWLQRVASCPICKKDLDATATSTTTSHARGNSSHAEQGSNQVESTSDNVVDG